MLPHWRWVFQQRSRRREPKTMMYTHVLNRSPLDGISPGDLLKQNRLLSDLTDTPLFDSSL